jgi:ribosomal protein S21
MVEIKRKKSESFESFMRRFKKRIMESGQLIQFKKIRFKRKEENKSARKKSAVFRLKAADNREYLKRIGRLPEEEMNRSKRR